MSDSLIPWGHDRSPSPGACKFTPSSTTERRPDIQSQVSLAPTTAVAFQPGATTSLSSPEVPRSQAFWPARVPSVTARSQRRRPRMRHRAAAQLETGRLRIPQLQMGHEKPVSLAWDSRARGGDVCAWGSGAVVPLTIAERRATGRTRAAGGRGGCRQLLRLRHRVERESPRGKTRQAEQLGPAIEQSPGRLTDMIEKRQWSSPMALGASRYSIQPSCFWKPRPS
jgi:hypothetical protein